MYNTILFDLDGTISDSKEGITKSVRYALKHFGIEVDNLDDLTCFIGPPLEHSFKEFCGFNEEDAAIGTEKYRERFREIGVYENSLYDGISDMLKKLKQSGKTIALATSKPQIFAEQILQRCNIDKYFDFICGSEFSGERGTKSEVIQFVLNALNITDTSKVIMVGDRKFDIEGAKKCNIDSVGVKFGFSSENELEDASATYIVSTVGELTEFLLTH